MYPLWVHAGKPRSPLQVSVSPVQSGLTPADIKPGDIVELKIVGKSFADADQLAIKVAFFGGAELVSGDTSWSGAVKKGEEKTLLISVRASRQGGGGLRARISMSPSGGASFVAGAEYSFGQNAKKKPNPVPAIKKDSKGREIREYRVQ